MRFHRGFSLVEVTLAMAIAALAITVILGITPAGLDSLRQAGNTSSETSITRQMLSELQAADWGDPGGAAPGWSRLVSYGTEKRFFDDQGTALTSGSGEFLSFVARYSFPSQPVVLPGSVPGAGPGPDLLYVTVDVAVTANPNYDFSDPALHTSRTWILARQY